MRRICTYTAISTLFGVLPVCLADTTWISTSSVTYSTAGNWNNGLPSTGPQLGIFQDSDTIQHTLDIAATGRNAVGLRFDLFTGGAGFVFSAPTTTFTTAGGFQIRTVASGASILNNDDNVQTFNVPVAAFSAVGGTGVGASQTWSAAGGDLVFSGQHNGTRFTVNNNGGMLTIDGVFNTTIGLGTGRGDIIGAGGLTKNGSGTLTLGGTVANTYGGGTIINSGRVVANKSGAFGSGSVSLNGGILDTGGYSQMLGTLDLSSGSTLDFGAGAAALEFGDSDSQDWNGSFLTVINWTPGVDSFRVGTDGTGFDNQLQLIRFADFDNAPGQIDANGFITPAPVPEPSTWVMLGMGALAYVVLRRRG